MRSVVKGIKIGCDGLVVSHLLYADDCIVLGEWSLDNIRNIAQVFKVFNICSSLKIHLGKSNLFGIGIGGNEVIAMAKEVNCTAGSLPFKHLGVWIGANMNRVANWNFLVDIFETRLSKWRASSLLESIMRKFLWGSSVSGRKIHWVSWDVIASPKSMGGLGISRLRNTNVALLSKWVWRYKTEINSLWRLVIKAIHDTKRGWNHIPMNKYLPGTLKNIVNCVEAQKVKGISLNSMLRGQRTS
uniref:uncharacterized protein LOC122601411 n=1 Tax=Erigeron canadensis TaxID=72917 RepID=UPI001CB8D2F3|nr:uncharacterized protein LOC122601411 [Erigeron canadensis]